MNPGAELESDRYLITVEEKLQHSVDSSQEAAKKFQEERQESHSVVHQPGKRKRQVLNMIHLNSLLLLSL